MSFWKKKEKKEEPEDPFESIFGEDFSKVFGRMFKDIQEQMQNMDVNLQEIEGQPGIKKRTYGFSMKVGPDGKVKIEEFGNVNPEKKAKKGRTPLVDVMNKGKEIDIIAELPGADEKNISVKLNKDCMKVTIEVPEKFYKEIELPEKVKKTVKKTFKNGILTIELKK